MANEAVDRRGYTVRQWYTVGQRMTDDYAEDDAVRDFCELHPEADPVAVRAELDASLAE